MKTYLIWTLLLVLAVATVSFILGRSGYPTMLADEKEHQHEFTRWADPTVSGEGGFMQLRSCTICGWAEKRRIK